MRSSGSIDGGRWQDCEVAGRHCQVATDADGEPVGRFVRPAVAERHPDAGATTPVPGRAGWVVDWFWPVSVLALGLTLFLCVGLLVL